ncbi:MAG: VOC family protein [Actinomycetales bacterium]|nr:VOC family protein [Actinomycetales bacterium]
MSTRDVPWPQGTPAWAELMASDVTAATEFYAGVLGWEIAESDPDLGDYHLATVDGRPVAGIGPSSANTSLHAVWTTYLASDDLETTCSAIVRHGGDVVMRPMSMGHDGRMALAIDPTGAAFGLWQAGQHLGSSITGRPGAMVWNECRTWDPEVARAFYAEVFGCTYTMYTGRRDIAFIDGEVPGSAVGAIGQVDPAAPRWVPPHWMIYFQVDDAMATTEEAAKRGAEVIHAGRDTPIGRIAIFRDPQGAPFSVVEPCGRPLRDAACHHVGP